jgi:citrate lyase subunit beta/citryl-CoA lyase
VTPMRMPGPAMLFCPGDRPERFGRALEVADVAIFDLEDAVGAGSKDSARAAVVDALCAGSVDARRSVVRINPPDSPAGRRDIEMLRDSPLETVMLPKATDPEAVSALAPWSVLGLCETAAGVLAAADLARVDNCIGLMWGGEDLTADIGGRASRGPDGRYLPHVEHARVSTLLAAAAAGGTAVDGVYLDIADTEGLSAESLEAARMGFAAKVAIHPAQVPHIRRAFAPSDDDLAWAMQVLEAVEDDTGVTTVGGRMIDEPILRQARAIVSYRDSYQGAGHE